MAPANYAAAGTASTRFVIQRNRVRTARLV